MLSLVHMMGTMGSDVQILLVRVMRLILCRLFVSLVRIERLLLVADFAYILVGLSL